MTEIGFSVGTNALFQPDEDTGVVTPMPRPEPAIAIIGWYSRDE